MLFIDREVPKFLHTLSGFGRTYSDTPLRVLQEEGEATFCSS